MSRILIAGCGYVGVELGLGLAAGGHEVFGLRRDPSALPPAIRPIAADLARRESPTVLPEAIDYAVYCVGADDGSDRAYRIAYLDGLEVFLRGLRDQGEKPRRVFFTSSTAVYGQEGGEWVDEESPTRPRREAGEIQLLAERLLTASGFPATVLRLGGIYGPGRTRMIDRVARGEAVVSPEPHYTNRIHRDDAASALRHLIERDASGAGAVADLYLGVDSEPADERDVVVFLAAEIGAAPPRERSAEDTEARQSRRAGSKRCRNDHLRGTGWQPRFPSYREGYRELLRSTPTGDGSA